MISPAFPLGTVLHLEGDASIYSPLTQRIRETCYRKVFDDRKGKDRAGEDVNPAPEMQIWFQLITSLPSVLL